MDLMAGGGCTFTPPKSECPAAGWQDNGNCCTLTYNALDKSDCAPKQSVEECAKQQCIHSKTKINQWKPLNYSSHPFTCCADLGTSAPPPPVCTAQDAPYYDQSCAQAHGDGFCCDPKYIDWSGQCGGWLSNGDHLKTCYYKCPQKGWDPKTQSCKDTNE